MKGKTEIYVKVPRDKIALLTKIIEGYDNLGIVSTLRPAEGLVVIRVTPDTETDVRRVLGDLSFALETTKPD